MLTTGQCLATRSATRNSLHQTRDVAPRLVTTVAQLGGEGGAGRTLGITVAGVQDWVVTGVRSGAGLGAVRRSGATWYWRIHHTGSTLTPQLIKADIVACLAVARVTQVLTMVEFAAQQPVTDLSAGVLHSDTTHFSTLVSSTHPFFLTLLLTPGIISSGCEVGAGNVLVHGSAPASHPGLQGTLRTWTSVTLRPAEMG